MCRWRASKVQNRVKFTLLNQHAPLGLKILAKTSTFFLTSARTMVSLGMNRFDSLTEEERAVLLIALTSEVIPGEVREIKRKLALEIFNSFQVDASELI